jgi:hypothetical protein
MNDNKKRSAPGGTNLAKKPRYFVDRLGPRRVFHAISRGQTENVF